MKKYLIAVFAIFLINTNSFATITAAPPPAVPAALQVTIVNQSIIPLVLAVVRIKNGKFVISLPTEIKANQRKQFKIMTDLLGESNISFVAAGEGFCSQKATFGSVITINPDNIPLVTSQAFHDLKPLIVIPNRTRWDVNQQLTQLTIILKANISASSIKTTFHRSLSQ